MKYQVIVPLVILFGVAHCIGKRFRRVINGVPFNGRPTTYSVIRYFGALASAHQTPFFTSGEKWKFLSWVYDYGQAFCSGSLLTPQIFQTACHCIAWPDADVKGHLKPPIKSHDWEGRAVVYPGVSNRFGPESMITYNPILTEKFLVHQKCAGIGKDDMLTYDYGLIVLDRKWMLDHSHPWKEIRYAPTYTERSMKIFHFNALEKQLVCMVIGFGVNDRYEDAASDFLLHGWETLMPRSECIKDKRLGWLYHVKKLKSVEILKYFNWVCARNFSKHDQECGNGDSGSPFTCDDRYIGLVSGKRWRTFDDAHVEDVSMYVHALVYTVYTNAVDYRKFFVRSIEDVNFIYVRSLPYSGLRNSLIPLKHEGTNSMQTDISRRTSHGLENRSSLTVVFIAVWMSFNN